MVPLRNIPKMELIGWMRKGKLEIKLEERLNGEWVSVHVVNFKHMNRVHCASQDVIKSVLEDLEISPISHHLLINSYESGMVPGLRIHRWMMHNSFVQAVNWWERNSEIFSFLLKCKNSLLGVALAFLFSELWDGYQTCISKGVCSQEDAQGEEKVYWARF